MDGLLGTLLGGAAEGVGRIGANEIDQRNEEKKSQRELGRQKLIESMRHENAMDERRFTAEENRKNQERSDSRADSRLASQNALEQSKYDSRLQDERQGSRFTDDQGLMWDGNGDPVMIGSREELDGPTQNGSPLARERYQAKAPTKEAKSRWQKLKVTVKDGLGNDVEREILYDPSSDTMRDPLSSATPETTPKYTQEQLQRVVNESLKRGATKEEVIADFKANGVNVDGLSFGDSTPPASKPASLTGSAKKEADYQKAKSVFNEIKSIGDSRIVSMKAAEARAILNKYKQSLSSMTEDQRKAISRKIRELEKRI